MASISSQLKLHDGMSNALMTISSALDKCINSFEQMQSLSASSIDVTNLSQAKERLNQIRQELTALQGIQVSPEPVAPQAPQTQQTPRAAPTWTSYTGPEVFTTTGADRFKQEISSADSLLQQLSATQDEIARKSFNTNIFPNNSVQDLTQLATRIDTLKAKIAQVESNPVNLGTEAANASLEQLRGQLSQAVQQQEILNQAVQNMDVAAANAAYNDLNATVGTTEQYIRDNVNEQGVFNASINEGAGAAGKLKTMIAGALAAYTGIAGIRKAISWINGTTEAFNTQRNAENQLVTVLGNMLDKDYVAQYEVEVIADTSQATAETRALEAEFDALTAKASKIQAGGIYGDEAMIGAAAEFATYFSDTDAISMMMDTLSDYAMGMTGGGALNSEEMVNYATNLGKMMTGAYDSMTKKGFEVTDVQKSIIEGTATAEQITEALGQEYVNMSKDMQAAAAISQVIEESWGGLYEAMSNTPEGKIIQLTNKWGDLKEMIGGQLYPFILLFVNTIMGNWPTIEGIVSGFTTALQFTMGVLSMLLNGAISFASAIQDNWSWIAPIITVVAAALAIYYGWQLLTTAATVAMTAAQWAYNAAMAANPTMLFVLGVIALVTAIYAAISALASLTGAATSGFGMITGAISVVIAFFQNLGLSAANIALGIASAIVALGSNMMAAFHNAISSIQAWFYDLLSTAMSVIAGIASALNSLPFVEFDYSGIASAADDYAAKSAAASANKQEYTSIADAFKSGSGTFDTFQSGWASKAFRSGADWGDGVVDSISSALSPSNLFGTTDIGSTMDYAYSSGQNLQNLSDNSDDIAGSSAAAAGALADSSENLEYLRDIAEQEAINRFTTAEVKIDYSGMTNRIDSNMDLDGVISSLTDGFAEALEMAAEGVHK